jgi:curved DNA-binding protein CbpA
VNIDVTMTFNILEGKTMDYYYILGILPTASADEIKAAHRRMAARYHPDRNIGKSDTTLQFKGVQEAYQILSDPEQRQLYDEARNTRILPDPIATAREIWANFINPLCGLR